MADLQNAKFRESGQNVVDSCGAPTIRISFQVSAERREAILFRSRYSKFGKTEFLTMALKAASFSKVIL